MIFEPPTRLAKQQCLKGLIKPDLIAALILTVQTIRAPRESQEGTIFYPTVSRGINTHQGRPFTKRPRHLQPIANNNNNSQQRSNQTNLGEFTG